MDIRLLYVSICEVFSALIDTRYWLNNSRQDRSTLYLIELNMDEDVIVLTQSQLEVFRSMLKYMRLCNHCHFPIGYSFEQSTYNSDAGILL